MKIKDLKNNIEKNNPDLKLAVQSDVGFQIGKSIEIARAHKKMTQKELAEKIGTQQPSIARIESGSLLPSISFLKKIAEAFDTQLVPPKFAFMENTNQQSITYNNFKSSISKTNAVLSPFQKRQNFQGEIKITQA
ncbi:TPA: hypothetical protein DEP58_04535 [Patescibacteria group bacterium]|nr:MAG: Helix-turn-helix domain protein [Parcubacteria group bacterium GW2011_GWD2_42_14]HCC05534.1 hypothetical protein [Patescibacteria group bacterium]